MSKRKLTSSVSRQKHPGVVSIISLDPETSVTFPSLSCSNYHIVSVVSPISETSVTFPSLSNSNNNTLTTKAQIRP